MSRIPLAITTGDVDGVGLEIARKALLALGPRRDFVFFLFRSSKAAFTPLKSFKSITVKSLGSALKINWQDYHIVEIASPASPATWFFEVAKACKKGRLGGVVTGPLSKTEIFRAGYKVIGHTEILQKVINKKNIFMGFIGNEMSLVLATGHVPIAKVRITRSGLNSAIQAADQLRKLLPKSRSRLPIAVLSLNPHAGENGIISNIEAKVFSPAIKALTKKMKVVGPLIGDAFFARHQWRKYSVVVSAYHDQGLIPFKMLHGSQSPGVHLTLGLPFVRTSVDHGTAKDIFGKNRADYKSMLAAIKLAIRLIRNED